MRNRSWKHLKVIGNRKYIKRDQTRTPTQVFETDQQIWECSPRLHVQCWEKFCARKTHFPTSATSSATPRAGYKVKWYISPASFKELIGRTYQPEMVGWGFLDFSCYQVCWETGAIWSNCNILPSSAWSLEDLSLSNVLTFKVSLYKVYGFEAYFLHFFHLSTFAAKIKRKGSQLYSAVFHFRIHLVMNAVVFHCTLVFVKTAVLMSVNCPLGKLCPCPDMNILGGELRAIWSTKVQT